MKTASHIIICRVRINRVPHSSKNCCTQWKARQETRNHWVSWSSQTNSFHCIESNRCRLYVFVIKNPFVYNTIVAQLHSYNRGTRENFDFYGRSDKIGIPELLFKHDFSTVFPKHPIIFWFSNPLPSAIESSSFNTSWHLCLTKNEAVNY